LTAAENAPAPEPLPCEGRASNEPHCDDNWIEIDLPNGIADLLPYNWQPAS
jgi:hypothetical protein